MVREAEDNAGPGVFQPALPIALASRGSRREASWAIRTDIPANDAITLWHDYSKSLRTLWTSACTGTMGCTTAFRSVHSATVWHDHHL